MVIPIAIGALGTFTEGLEQGETEKGEKKVPRTC